MLFFDISADRQNLSILFPEAKIQLATMYCAYGVEKPAYLVTFATVQEEAIAIAKVSYNDNLHEALVKEARQ